MICFLTSSPILRVSNQLNPANSFVDELKNTLKPKARALFVCSDPEMHERTLFFADAVRAAMVDAGFSFSSFEILDGSNRESAGVLVRSADFIILAGGHVPTQNRFFREIGLKELLRGFGGVILGISAGTMNAADIVYAQPEEEGEAIDPDYRRFLPGLGLTKAQILPHYDSTRHDVLDGLRVFEDVTYPDSMGRCFYALVDGSYLLIRDGREVLHGETFQIRDGVLSRVCKKGEARELSELVTETEDSGCSDLLPEELVTLRLPYPGREERIVRVYVPARREGERFPVVYMSDGHNLFDKETSGYGCWFTREAVRQEQRHSGKAAIIVGIHNDQPFRMEDLTPAEIGVLASDVIRREINPKGEDFAVFLVHTVMPKVESRFPALTGKESTAYCGSSAGGVMAFYLALRYPDLFCAAGVLSPAFLLYRRRDLARWIRASIRPQMPFLYLYSGAGDPGEKAICRSFHRVCAVLETCCPKDRFCARIQPKQIHHEDAWEPVFRDFLHEFLK